MRATSSGATPGGGFPSVSAAMTRQAGAHLRPVLDGLPDVTEDREDPCGDRRDPLLVGLAVDRQRHPRLAELAHRPGRARRVLGVDLEDSLERTEDVTTDDELRMDDEVDVDAFTDELTRHRVDEERHVVGDHLDHRPRVQPELLLDRSGEDGDVGGPWRPVQSEGQMVGDSTAEHLDGAIRQLLGGNMPVVALGRGPGGPQPRAFGARCAAT